MKLELRNRLSPRARKWFLWSGVAFVLYLLVGFLLLPAIIKWQLEKQLPAVTKRRVAVQQVKVNPLTLSLTVRGLSLTEPEGRPFASWDELYVNFQASSLFRWAWTFKEIRLVNPFGEIILFKDGRLNFANMLEPVANAPTKAPAKAPSTAIPRINIFQLQITNGFVALEDRTLHSLFRAEYRPINIELKEFTTRPDSETPYSFRAQSDTGRTITWAGDLTVQPLRSGGHLELTGVRLARYEPYLEMFTSAQLTNGLADLQLSYRLSAGTNGLDLVVTNGAMQVAKVQVIDPGVGETVAGLGGLDVRNVQFNLRERSVNVTAVKVSEATLLARLTADGKLNLMNLITLPEARTNASSRAATAPTPVPWKVTVDDFAIEKTAVSFEDLTRHTPFKSELKPIEVSVKHFTTQPASDASYSFALSSEAAETFKGTGTVSINPIRSSGELTVNPIDVKKYLPYAEDFFRGKILSGKIEVHVPYRFAMATNSVLAGVTNLSVKLTDLEVELPENPETVTHIDEVGFERVDANLENRSGRVGLFRAAGGSVLVRRQKDGKINLLGLLAVSRTNSTPTSAGESAKPPLAEGARTNAPTYALGGWTLNLDELQLDNYKVKVEDLIPEKPATLLLDQLSLNVTGASTDTNVPVDATVSFRLNETGSISAKGTARRAPPSADFDVAISNLDLRIGQPYLDPFVALNLSRGGLSTAGKVRFQTNDPAAPLLMFAGGLSLTNFGATDQASSKEFVSWNDLDIKGFEAALLPTHVKIDELRLVQPKAVLLVGADGRLNVSSLTKQKTAEAKTPEAAAPPPGANPATNGLATVIPVELGTLELDRAELLFTDESVKPNVAFGVEEISGTIKGLTSALNTPADVDLHGKVNAQSPFSITGRLNPFAATMFVDLTITNGGTQLVPLTGYMEKYAGHPLQKGRFSTSLHYRVEGKVLEAENKIEVDQLTLGPHNNSPDATTLPVKLGVALLKDSEGRIQLDVPVTGKLDDPQFKLGPIILKVIGNILVKAAASPFKLLGSLVGGGGDELSFIEFTPGTTDALEGGPEKLGKLAAALGKRPSLNLEIEGNIDPATDRDALARLKLREQLQTKRVQELTAAGRTPDNLEAFKLAPEESNRLLRAAFVDHFGTNIAEVLATNLVRQTSTNRAASTPAPEPKRSLFKRVAGLFKGGSGESKAEKNLSKKDQHALGLATPDTMEELLAENITITDEEFRALMSARAQWVRDWIVKNSQVGADRLLLVAPKPVDTNYTGQSRATLSVN